MSTSETPMQQVRTSQTSLLCIVADNDSKNDLTAILRQYYIDLKVTFARDGVEAVIYLEELNPDIIVMDMDIPEYDYTLTYRILKEYHKLNRVIPLSARILDRVMEKCRNFGLDYCLCKKPLSTEVFRIKLDLAVNTLIMGTDNDRFNQAKSDFFRKPESL